MKTLRKSSKSVLKDLRLLFSSYSIEREVWSRFVLRKILHLAPQGESHILKETKKELKEGGWQKVRTSPQANENWVAKSTHPCVKRRIKSKEDIVKIKSPKSF